MSGKINCFGMTDIGHKRLVNEDQFIVADLSKSMRIHQTSLGLDHQTRLFGHSQGKLLAIADGLGGHEAGERASQLAVDSIVTYVLNTLNWYFSLGAESDKDFRDELKATLQHCQTMLQRDVEATPQRRGMGTTLTMAYIVWPRMYVVHVGDSRCYLLRDGKLKQITRDHTMAQLYKETREVPALDGESKDEATGRSSHTLWNAIGTDNPELDPEVYAADIELSDTILLCTDGLTKYVDNPRLIELLTSKDSIEAICQRMIDEANNAGGSDNITVIISRFSDVTDAEAKAASRGELTLKQGKPDPLADTGSFPAMPAVVG